MHEIIFCYAEGNVACWIGKRVRVGYDFSYLLRRKMLACKIQIPTVRRYSTFVPALKWTAAVPRVDIWVVMMTVGGKPAKGSP